MIVEVVGDITDFPNAKFIAHQCNCVSQGQAAGVARSIFDKYPWADVYKGRILRSSPGTNKIISNNEKVVINMFAQYYPGGPKYDSDNSTIREKYFKSCIKAISQRSDIDSIAFPKYIGCGIAGGDWENYFNYIKELDEDWKNQGKNVKIYIVDWNGR